MLLSLVGRCYGLRKQGFRWRHVCESVVQLELRDAASAAFEDPSMLWDRLVA